MIPRGGGSTKSEGYLSDWFPFAEFFGENGLKAVSRSSRLIRVITGPLNANRFPIILSDAFTGRLVDAIPVRDAVDNLFALGSGVGAGFSDVSCFLSCPRTVVIDKTMRVSTRTSRVFIGILW